MLCATLLRHTPPERQGRFYRWSDRMFDRIIAAYGTSLRWVLGHQPTTLLVAVATLALTVMLYDVVPKGFFPVQDTGVIQGISDAPQSISLPAMATRQQALAQVILKDPAVESLSSFIGVDGTNVTLNSGRILINLKPLAQRQVSASEVIRRLQSELAKVKGITLFMQPVQDLTVDDRVSRTQYQYSLDDPNGAELNAWAPRLVDALRARPELQDVSSDQQDQGLGTAVFIDRSTASRLGVSPQTIDDTLYDAFGQRQVSTMFTQLNQYRVVLEVKPHFRQNPEDLHNIYVRSASSAQGVPLSGRDDVAARHHAPGAVSSGDAVVQPGAGRGAGRGGDRDPDGDAAAGAADQHPGQLLGHGASVPGFAGQRAPVDRRGAGGGLPRARRAV
jgi:multidrug efflux pump